MLEILAKANDWVHVQEGHGHHVRGYTVSRKKVETFSLGHMLYRKQFGVKTVG